MFDFRNQDVTGDSYLFRRSSYSRESAQANRLRGVSGSAADSEVASTSSSKRSVAAQNTRLHKVKKGETLFAIARKRGTTVDELRRLNRLGKNPRLLPGQILKYN
jgi:LysM repeat protein